MKIKILILVAIFAFASNISFAQFDKFVLQFSAGITNPDKGLRGNNYVNYSNQYRYVNNVFHIDSVFTFPYEIILRRYEFNESKLRSEKRFLFSRYG